MTRKEKDLLFFLSLSLSLTAFTVINQQVYDNLYVGILTDWILCRCNRFDLLKFGSNIFLRKSTPEPVVPQE